MWVRCKRWGTIEAIRIIMIANMGLGLSGIVRGGVYLLLAMLPFHSVLVLPGVSVLRLVGIIFAPIWLIWLLGKMALHQAPLTLSRKSFVIIFLSFWLLASILLSSFYAPLSPFFFPSTLTVLSGIVMAVVIATTIRSERAFVQAFRCLAFGGTVAAALVIAEFVAPELLSELLRKRLFALEPEVIRATGPFDDPNYGALVLTVLGCVTLCLASASQSWRWRFCLYGAVVLQVTAVILTFSRGGYITLGLVALAILWRERRRIRFWRLALACGVVIIAFLMFGATLVDQVFRRAATLVDFARLLREDPIQARQLDLSLWYRLNLALGGLRMAVAHFPLGVGWGNFQFRIIEYAEVLSQVAHNTYITVATELGLVGVLFFLFLLYSIWMACEQITRTAPDTIALLATGLGNAFVAYLSGSFFLNTLTEEVLLWVIAGLTMAMTGVLLGYSFTPQYRGNFVKEIARCNNKDARRGN